MSYERHPAPNTPQRHWSSWAPTTTFRLIQKQIQNSPLKEKVPSQRDDRGLSVPSSVNSHVGFSSFKAWDTFQT